MEFVIKNKENNEIIYEVVDNKKIIGGFTLTIHENHSFLNCITVLKEFRRCGYGTKIMNEIMEKTAIPIIFCISTHSNSAVYFWPKYLNDCVWKNEHIRGEIYKILKERK